uniref:CG-1 domain-containing protein n=1 Tax=Neogobius melanostomus TaxID=47308 RepID=A0A8C6V8R4_9GOBI
MNPIFKTLRKVFVPNKLLECLPRSAAIPSERLRWNTNEEIASFLISFDRHDEWLCCSLKTNDCVSSFPQAKNGSIILYNRKKVKYRKDEDHMKTRHRSGALPERAVAGGFWEM